ncbi:hypothetical protein CEUSTIGMA_g7712.t1 [Chlamydomonas eustigma]|uniref:Peptidase C1A papain C-terminal domain-containing protein n=1 Tax=Chlamydomonas eustigma TaxID=1157962 RepID=A0A250XB37_9CHLO|nr:hypothetical protein CEUSTIGMA_g7712.t1 [Chlamydomonas eustigma]|eukprot:GAX80274.1 hypothetical protein CEUSTIGMA_g7712.t1 [Chlamydomonas eustigma]
MEIFRQQSDTFMMRSSTVGAFLLLFTFLRQSHCRYNQSLPILEPYLPPKFEVSFLVSRSSADPLQTFGTLVTIARDGAHIGIHYPLQNSSAFWKTDCLSTDSAISSAQVSFFNIIPKAGTNETGGIQQRCFFAQPGQEISTGEWILVKAILSAWIWFEPGTWRYGGQLTTQSTPMDLWSRDIAHNSAVTNRYIQDSTNRHPVKLITQFSGDSTTWDFIPDSLKTYSDNESVSLAHIPFPESEIRSSCLSAKNAYPASSCPSPNKAHLMNNVQHSNSVLDPTPVPPNWKDLMEIFNQVYTGMQPGALRNYRHMKPYHMVKSSSNQPSSFYLGSYNFTDVPDILNQLICGSCYAFSAAASLSSVFSQKSGQHYTFSPQFIMDCIPYSGIIQEEGSGCWGGLPGVALDFIIDIGAIVPVQLDYPYAGVQGRCDLSIKGVSTRMTHYERPNTTEQLKDAVMNHGAVSVALKSQGAFSAFKPSSTILSGFPRNLGVGVSCSKEDSTGELSDHAVILVGWAACEIPVTPGGGITGATVPAPNGCWMIQNSWGDNNGYQGLYFVDADPQHDCGIHVEAVIPIIPQMDHGAS